MSWQSNNFKKLSFSIPHLKLCWGCWMSLSRLRIIQTISPNLRKC